jgi:hypothetical protein
VASSNRPTTVRALDECADTARTGRCVLIRSQAHQGGSAARLRGWCSKNHYPSDRNPTCPEVGATEMASTPRGLKLRSSGDVDWSNVLKQQQSENRNNLSCGIDYLRRTATPRRNRPPTGVDPLTHGPVQYDSPPRPAAVTFAAESARPGTASSPAQPRGHQASAALYVSELDFHLGRVVELLRRSDRVPLPKNVASKVHQIAAFDALCRTQGVD